MVGFIYKDPHKYAMGFQLKILQDFMYLEKYKQNQLIFTERSPQDSFHIFGKMLHKDDMLSDIEFELLKDYINILHGRTIDGLAIIPHSHHSPTGGEVRGRFEASQGDMATRRAGVL